MRTAFPPAGKGMFCQEEVRVRSALMEIERQTVKLLIVSQKASALRQHADAAIADLKIVTAESVAACRKARHE